MPKLDGRIIEAGKVTVTLNASGTGTAAVTFSETFISTPDVLVVSREGDAGTYTAASKSKTGFTATVTTSDITSQDVTVRWVAHQKD